MPKKALGFIAALLFISATGYAVRYGLSRSDIAQATDVATAENA
jgi:hypothetical protein